jgi:hypothetical protein
MSEFQKKKIKSNVLAEVLFTEFIINKDLNSKFRLCESWDISNSFEYKVILHKKAIVLLAILTLEVHENNFKRVRERFEKLIYSADVVDGMFSFIEVRNAMENLSELCSLRDNSGQWIIWGISWLKEAGITETNPIRSFQLACMWVDNYLTIMDYLKKYDPE